MRHHPNHTLTVNHRGVNMNERETAVSSQQSVISSQDEDRLPNNATRQVAATNREAFLAADPTGQRRRVHDAHMTEFREKFAALVDGLKPMLHGIVAKAEQLREVGIVMVEFCESLPGGKLTIDLYEQHRPEFTDARGQTASFAFLEAALKAARENLNPIDNLHTALKYRQPLLMATGDQAFVLESAPPPQKAVPQADPLAELKKILDPADLSTALKNLRANPNYFPDGHLRDTLRETLVEQWKPTFDLMDELRRELGI